MRASSPHRHCIVTSDAEFGTFRASFASLGFLAFAKKARLSACKSVLSYTVSLEQNRNEAHFLTQVITSKKGIAYDGRVARRMKRTLYAFADLPYALPNGFAHRLAEMPSISPGILRATERQDIWMIRNGRAKNANDGSMTLDLTWGRHSKGS